MTKKYTLEEVAKHTSENDCWVVIEGKVYDVTKWLPDHPGGRKILLQQGGRDATDKFKTYHARSILENIAPKFYIGDVAEISDGKETNQGVVQKYDIPDEIPDYSPIPFANPPWYQDLPSAYFTDPSYAKVRNFVRQFVTKEIMPFVEEWDEAKRIPKEVYLKCGQAGLIAACAGTAYEHPELCPYGLPAGIPHDKWDVFHSLIVMDEICRTGSGGVAWGLVGGMGIGIPPIVHFGSKEMQMRIVPDVVSGKKFACLGITEPSGGSDVANLTTTAVESPDGKSWIVNGEKKWITNGVFADYFTVAVRTGGAGMNGISLLLLERTMPGITTRQLNCSGVWCSGTSYITFEDVVVPKSNLIGKLNKGFKVIVSNFNNERMAIAMQCLRFARCVFEDAMVWANKRKTFGQKLIDNALIRNKFGHMARQIEACQAWVESLVYQMKVMPKDQQMIHLGGPIALCKVQATQLMHFCCTEAAQIFGGLAFTRGGQAARVERLYREVRAFAIPGGSEEIMLDLGIRQSVKVGQMMGAKL